MIVGLTNQNGSLAVYLKVTVRVLIRGLLVVFAASGVVVSSLPRSLKLSTINCLNFGRLTTMVRLALIASIVEGMAGVYSVVVDFVIEYPCGRAVARWEIS